MQWLILVILLLLLFIVFLVFRIYTIGVSLHDTVYALLNQIVILRDATMRLKQEPGSGIHSDLQLYSFFSQGDMGDIMIKRHRALLEYVELVGSKYPTPVATWVGESSPASRSRTELLAQISDYDSSLNKWLSFNMHTVTMYTVSMIDKLFDNNYDSSLLAVKGFLSVVH